jgi:hypothetical protein
MLTEVAGITAEQLGIDTLEERLRAEVVGMHGVQLLPPLVGAWARG